MLQENRIHKFPRRTLYKSRTYKIQLPEVEAIQM